VTAAFALLNAERTAAGLGVVQQLATLDTAADGHSNYLAINNDYGAEAGLTEAAGTTGFVAATTSARLAAAGFSGTATEVAIGSERVAVDGIRAALASPFRRLTLLDHGVADVGLGFVEPGSTRPAGTASVNLSKFWGALVATTGVRSTALPQAMLGSAGEVSVYPSEGATEVPVVMYRESPNPVETELGAWGSPFFPGYAVSLQLPRNKDLVVSTFALSRVVVGGNTAVLAKLLDANDTLFLRPNGIRNWAVLVPLTPLAIGATYQATLNGTAGGVAFTKTWQFSTRSGFTASAPQREPVGSQVTIRYTSPSGILQLASPEAFTNCGASYNPAVIIGTQSVTLRENVSPQAGCTVTLKVLDLGTPTSDTRTFTLN
jgi:hypothetical protein